MKSEAELISQAQQGDQHAFDELDRIHRTSVFKLCFRMTRNREEAEDLTQDTFLRLLSVISTFRGESKFSTWLHRIALNIVLMKLRKKKLPTTPLEFENDEGEIGPRDVTYNDARLAVVCETAEVIKAIEALPDGYRAVFILHAIEGYEHKEIADMFGFAKSTARTQFMRATLKIRAALWKDQANA